MQTIKTFLSHGIEFSCKESALQHDKLIDAYEQLRFAKRNVEQLKQGCSCSDYRSLGKGYFGEGYECICCQKTWRKSDEGSMECLCQGVDAGESSLVKDYLDKRGK